MNKLLCVYVCVCLQFRVQIPKPEVVIDFAFHATICVDLDLCTPFLEGGINLSFNELVEAVHGEMSHRKFSQETLGHLVAKGC